MDNGSESEQHKEQVHKLLQLTGLGDDIDIGDPKIDQEIMNTICGVLENFDPLNQFQAPTRKEPAPARQPAAGNKSAAIAREESKRALVSAFSNPESNEDTQFSAQLQHFQTTNQTA